MRWTDIHDIAIALEDKFPQADVTNLRFTDLRAWVMELEEFADEPKNCNEKVLEAIQAAWLEERS
jgi:FeS assembly protein IscX